MSEARIAFDRVWKKFHRGERHDSLREFIPALARRMVGRSAPETELAADDFWAVRDLSFEVRPGQTLGIIGSNGSGKSTTLRMLTKIIEPTRGRSEVRGRVGALIEVSAGFHGDLTGRENVFLQGAIMGMRSKQIERKFDEIVAFSGIEEFIDTPVKRYSSGMNARLGFAIAAHLEPDVLIIDEVLAVGDMGFQQKAFGRIHDLANSGIPVVIVSHQLDRVAELCTDAILLRRGEVAFRGTPRDTISAYVMQVDETTGAEESRESDLVGFGPMRMVDDRPVPSGGWFAIQAEIDVRQQLHDSIEPLKVRVRSLVTGRIVYRTGSHLLDLDLSRPGHYTVRVDLQANLTPGDYVVEVFATDELAEKFISVTRGAPLQVTDPGTYLGQVPLNAQMQVLSEPAERLEEAVAGRA